MLLCYRYLIKFRDSADKIHVKIVCDTAEGLAKFHRLIRQDSSIVKCAREYCYSVDVDKLGIIQDVLTDLDEHFDSEENVSNEKEN